MGPAFAAVGAGVAALLDSTIVSRYQIVGAQLQMTLVFVIAATIVFGFQTGLSWALVGGLGLDFFALRPLGSTVFALLIAVALVMITEPILSRSRYAGCVIATLVVTPMFLVISSVTSGLTGASTPALHPTTLVAAGVANAALAALLSLLLIGIKRRAENRERVLWWR
jgi:cell shape-determining protein MreD